MQATSLAPLTDGCKSAQRTPRAPLQDMQRVEEVSAQVARNGNSSSVLCRGHAPISAWLGVSGTVLSLPSLAAEAEAPGEEIVSWLDHCADENEYAHGPWIDLKPARWNFALKAAQSTLASTPRSSSNETFGAPPAAFPSLLLQRDRHPHRWRQGNPQLCVAPQSLIHTVMRNLVARSRGRLAGHKWLTTVSCG